MHHYDEHDLKAQILQEIREVADRLQKTPTINEYKRERPRSGYDKIIFHFGTWNEAVRKAGIEPNPTAQPPRNDIPRDALLSELVRVANEIGRFPSHPIFNAKSKYSRGPVERVFGSWSKARAYVLRHYSDRLTFDVAAKSTRGGASRRERKDLGICGPLLYQPRNEAETLCLFILLAEELGFRILKVGSQFPDLTLERMGKEVLAEVEFLSSNYLAHGHPLENRYTCICWRSNKNLRNIKVIELEGYVRNKIATQLLQGESEDHQFRIGRSLPQPDEGRSASGEPAH